MKVRRTKHGVFLRTDEREDVIASLEVCVDCLKQLAERPIYWKWVIMSLHNALQGAMVCHLSGTAELGALTNDSAKQQLEFLQNRNDGSSAHPRTKLATFPELFKRLSGKSATIEQAGKPISIADAEKKSVDRLNGLRRSFAHFSPKGWSIELSGMPQIISDVCSVLSKISDDPWPYRHLSTTRKQYLNRLVRKINRLASGLDNAN